jgi:hypothetical protein
MSSAIQPIPAMLQTAVINDATGSLAAVAAQSGKVIRVWGLVLTLASATTLTVKSGTTALSGPMSVSGMTLDPPRGRPSDDCAFPWWETAAGEALNLVLGGAVQMSGTLLYTVG